MPFCRDNNGVQLTLDDIPKEGMIKSRFMPGGFLKVDRIVYETIIAKGLAPSYGAGKFYHFYYGKIVLDNLLSEDYSFCELAREAGFQGWINCGIRVNHDGRTLDPQQNMPATQPATTASAA
jgi:hypothetical protein